MSSPLAVNIKTGKLDMAGEIIEQANKAGANTIEVLGFSLSDPRRYRAEAIAGALERPVSGAINIGSGRGYRIRELAETVCRVAGGASAQEKFVLHGASQFDEKHAFTRLMRKFEQLVQIYYTGDGEIEFVMHPNSELGLEKDYFAYMNQGISVDYAVVA